MYYFCTFMLYLLVYFSVTASVLPNLQTGHHHSIWIANQTYILKVALNCLPLLTGATTFEILGGHYLFKFHFIKFLIFKDSEGYESRLISNTHFLFW